MAKTTAPLLSFGASGTVAKTAVYSKWRGRQYVRRHVIPGNPQTAEQSLTRDSFRNAESIWKVAGPLFRAPWDRLAVGQVLLGRNAFIGRYISSLRVAADLQNMVFSPGAKGGLPPTTVTATGGVGTITVDIVEPPLPTGWTIQAGVAACILDGDPQTITTFTTTEGEDLTTPYSIILTVPAGAYVAAGWLRWLKPDGSIAYGAALNDTATAT